MSERSLWETARTRLSAFGKLLRVENTVVPGTPDFYYRMTHPRTGRTGAGWIEMKHVTAWPHSTETPTWIKSLRLDQVEWAEEWSAAGERVGMLLIVSAHYYLIPAGSSWRKIYDQGTSQLELESLSAVPPSKKFPLGACLEWMTH